jgi:3-oxoadipate enol-lactonase
VHAGIGDRGLWDEQIGPFAERFRVIRPDLRGFGGTPLPGGPFSNVNDLRALLDHLEIGRAALVGNSFGGRVCLDFALEHPERVGALVLVNSAPSGHEGSPALDALDEEEDALLEAGRIDDAVELTLRTWLGPVGATARERVAAMARRSYEVVLAAYEREPPPGPVAWADPPAAARLTEIRAVTLVVAGADDLPDFLAISERLAAEIPGARKELVEGARHVPALERPDEFNRIVLGFLDEVYSAE